MWFDVLCIEPVANDSFVLTGEKQRNEMEKIVCEINNRGGRNINTVVPPV